MYYKITTGLQLDYNWVLVTPKIYRCFLNNFTMTYFTAVLEKNYICPPYSSLKYKY